MKIAFVGTEGIPGNYGGFETFVDNMAYRLTEQGIDVTVFQPSDYIVHLENTRYKQVHIEYVKCPKNKYLRAMLKRINAYRMMNHEYDIVHNFGILPRFNRLFNKKAKTITTIDGFEWERASYNAIFRKMVKNDFIKAATTPDLAVCDSMIVHDYFLQKGIKTEFLPYGANFIEKPTELYPEFQEMGLEKRNYIYFVGRFVPEKNIARLINDYMKIKHTKKLVIIGKGNEQEKHEEELRNLGQQDPRIIFTGALYGESYQNLIGNADGYVSTSKIEGTSPSLLDALGANQKVLVSDIPENRSTLQNHGHYYPLNDSDNSILMLEKFLNNTLYSEDELAKLHNFALETYTWDGIVRKYIRILRELYEN